MVGIRGIIREGIGAGIGMRRGRRRGGGGWISRGFGGVELKGVRPMDGRASWGSRNHIGFSDPSRYVSFPFRIYAHIDRVFLSRFSLSKDFVCAMGLLFHGGFFGNFLFYFLFF